MGTTLQKKPVVLVADDDLSFCTALAKSFKNEGNDLYHTPTLLEAIPQIHMHEDENRRVVVLVNSKAEAFNAILTYTRFVRHRVMAYVIQGNLNGRNKDGEPVFGEVHKWASLLGAYDVFNRDDLVIEEDARIQVAKRVNNTPVWLILDEMVRDDLTGLDNLRGFKEKVRLQLEAMIDRRRQSRDGRERRGLHQNRGALLIFDADRFKGINDTYGHLAGDAAIIAIAEAGKESVRHSDLLCRKSGDEFLIWLPETSLDQAVERGQRLQCQIAKTQFFGRPNELVSLSISFGAAEIQGDDIGESIDATLTDLIDRADGELIRAKDRLGSHRRRG